MKIDDAKWAHICVSVLMYIGFVGIGIAVVGGVLGVEYSVEIGGGIFLLSRLCLAAVDTPKPTDRGEEAGSDDHAPEWPALKAKKIRRKV